jgi:integrase
MIHYLTRRNDVGTVPATLSEQAKAYVRASKAGNTQRAYAVAWQDFSAWCLEQGREPLPAAPETIGEYLSDQASTHKIATLRLRLAAIRERHRTAGFRIDASHPAIRDLLTGIARVNGSAPRKVGALTVEQLRDLVRHLGMVGGLKAIRDQAVLLVGFAAALRRSEIVALDVGDIQIGNQGLTLTLRRRKTDQEGAGTEIAVPYGRNPETCPVRALEAWLDASGRRDSISGPVFLGMRKAGKLTSHRLSDRDVARIIKLAAVGAGYGNEQFSGHSLRAGFVTSAAEAGVPEWQIAQQSGHKSVPVLRGYIRRARLFHDNPAAKVGL